MKPPLVIVNLLDELFKIGHGVTSITNNQVIAFKLPRAYMSLGDINFVLHKKIQVWHNKRLETRKFFLPKAI